MEEAACVKSYAGSSGRLCGNIFDFGLLWEYDVLYNTLFLDVFGLFALETRRYI